MSAAFDSVRVPKAAELVASELRRQIITGVLSADDALPSESALMEQFRVSRPTLREAIRILESESLVDVRRGARGGARVRVPEGTVAARYVGYLLQYRDTKMSDVYRARTILERPLGAAVARSRSKKALQRLDHALAESARYIDDPDRFRECDLAFHTLIAELAGNETIGIMVGMIHDILVEARRRVAEAINPDQARIHREVQRTHEYYVDLIRRGDAEGAEELWSRHLDQVEISYTSRRLARTVVEMMA
jgi:DNA-binding FadR family transcriptional regulator